MNDSPAVTALRAMLTYQIAVQTLARHPSVANDKAALRAKHAWVKAGSPTFTLPQIDTAGSRRF